ILLISDDKSAVSAACGNVSNKSIPALSAFSSKTLDIPVPKSESSYALITVVKSSSNFSFICLTYSKNRSEDHTTEIQSQFDLICRLLLDMNMSNDLFFYS